MRSLWMISLLLLTTVAGCKKSAPEPETPPGAPEAPALEAQDEASGAPEEVSLVGAPPPNIILADQVCETAEDCRAFRPADWNPRVECCYEYDCDLGYVAVNRSTWSQLRAWQRANPFDCSAHLQTDGPCNIRSRACGLIQDAPAIACTDGRCALPLPEVWPVVDQATQYCMSDAECVSFHSSASVMSQRCCGRQDEGHWLAINQATSTEIERWLQAHAPSCDSWRESHSCASAPALPLTPPGAVCRGGECRLSGLPPEDAGDRYAP